LLGPLYTNFLPANLALRLGYSYTPYASGGGIGINFKL
jgi:hypothetical protein